MKRRLCLRNVSNTDRKESKMGDWLHKQVNNTLSVSYTQKIKLFETLS